MLTLSAAATSATNKKPDSIEPGGRKKTMRFLILVVLLTGLAPPVMAQKELTSCGDDLAKSAAAVLGAYKKNPRVFIVLVKENVNLKVAPTSGGADEYEIPTVCQTTEGFFAVSLSRKNISMIAYQSGAIFYKVSHLVSIGTFRGWVAHDDVTEYGVLSREELKTIQSYARPRTTKKPDEPK